MENTLLVELLTEELPPNALLAISEDFSARLSSLLKKDGLSDDENEKDTFATPRRLAVVIYSVRDRAKGKPVYGPVVSAGFDKQGRPTPPLVGFAKKWGVPPEALERARTEKGEQFVFTPVSGAILDGVLAGHVSDALRRLPIPKVMRWGSSDTQFVRPVHGLVMLHGERVVPGEVLGQVSGRETRGHRFLGQGSISIPNADVYAELLQEKGYVIASFRGRREKIRDQLKRVAGDAVAFQDEVFDLLLPEVTALVEYPAVYAGRFDKAFLSVPQECLILTMRQHQKYFPLFDRQSGTLLNQFLIVSNLETADSRNIVAGNERVLRARLSDAKFFYDQDRKTRLEARVPQLANVVYHNKLGNQFERVERIQLLAGLIARQISADVLLAERAAWLSKADLLTDMVGEFPELQGTMGRYYALHDGEPTEVADAIGAHYRPRFAGGALPDGPTACALALADKLDTLAGFFGIGQVPTGDKDPFGLRRAALGMIRILIERDLALTLQELVDAAFAGYSGRVGDAHAELQLFIFDRLAGYLRDRGYTTLEVESVISLRPVQISLVPRQVEAVRAFNTLPEAQSLAAANKRVVNILKQAEAKGESFIDAEAAKLKEPAERALFDALRSTSRQAALRFNQGDFTGYMKTFAVLKSPVDAFFDSVMVMVDDHVLRHNRLALLADLRREMNRVADISKLAA